MREDRRRKYEIESIIIVRKCNLGGTSRALRTIPLAKDRNSTKSKIREACADVALTPFHGLLGNVEAVVRPRRRDVARECRRDSDVISASIGRMEVTFGLTTLPSGHRSIIPRVAQAFRHGGLPCPL